MTALFEQGFFVRTPAWHKQGVVLDDYPGRELAMELAGHNFDVVEAPIFEHIAEAHPESAPVQFAQIGGWKAHKRSDTGALLHVSKDSFERIPNALAYDVAELLIDGGFEYETGITLNGGAECALTLLLDEPIAIDGDDSITLPYAGLSWAHDGTAALKVRSTSVRQVCANTVSASEAEGKRLGTDFIFRHTKNVRERIEDAKLAIRGIRDDFQVYTDLMNELAAIEVTEEQRDLFVWSLLPAPPEALISERVMNNVDRERAKVKALFDGQTIPEAHKLTAYGLQLAAVEYLDHLRGYRNQDSYTRRTLLRDEPAKKKLGKLIREVVAA